MTKNTASEYSGHSNTGLRTTPALLETKLFALAVVTNLTNTVNLGPLLQPAAFQAAGCLKLGFTAKLSPPRLQAEPRRVRLRQEQTAAPVSLVVTTLKKPLENLYIHTPGSAITNGREPRS